MLLVEMLEYDKILPYVSALTGKESNKQRQKNIYLISYTP